MNTTGNTAVQANGAAHVPLLYIQQAAPSTDTRAADDRGEGGGNLRYILLTKLVPSPLNVRKTGGISIDELAMLIDSQGLLQNLIIIPHAGKRGKPSDRFEVVAGGRRLLALRRLAELDKIGKAEPKARIVEAVTEAVSAEAGAQLVNDKKAEAVAKAEGLLGGTRWLPAPLRPR